MKEQKIRIRIIPVERSEMPLDNKSAFWGFVSQRIEKESNYPEKLEYEFKKNFGHRLKVDLREKFRSELQYIERSYNIDLDSHRFFRGPIKEERGYNDDYFSSISKLQELKNEYFKDNVEYQKLSNKVLLSNQIDFGIENISYSSLGLDLSIEPIEKVIQLFDNNFDLFRIFLDQYIPESFLSSISASDDKLPVTTSIEYSESFKSEFEKTTNIEKTIDNISQNKSVTSSKWEKAKWAWSLTNGTLVVPVILALIVFYVTFNKIDDIFKIRQENYKEIKIENDKMFQNYQELIQFQKTTYKDLIEEIKKDTIE